MDRKGSKRIGNDRIVDPFHRRVKGSDRIVDPLLTKGSGSDRRSQKKGSVISLYINYTCRDVYCFGLAKSGDFQRYGGALALNFSKMSTRRKMTGKAFALAKTRI